MKNSIITTVEDCLRCGKTHTNLEFKLFKNNPVEVRGVAYKYWSICPTNREPILLHVIDGEDDYV